MFEQAVALVLLMLGSSLLLLAAQPGNLRPAGIASETRTQFKTGATLTPTEATRYIKSESSKHIEYLRRINTVVHLALAHYWPPDIDEVADDARVPLTENYLLWAGSHAPGRYGRHFKSYNFVTHELAFERGFGQCSQFVYALRDVLERYGFDTCHQSLDGHVVAIVDLNGDKVVADPDYDVVVPYALKEIRNDPSLVREYYAEAAPIREHIDKERYPLDYVESLYEPPYADFDPEEYHFQTVERISYTLVWILPMLFLFASLLLFAL